MVAYEKRRKKKKRVYDRKTRTESRNERMNDTTTTLSIPTALQVTTDYGKLKNKKIKRKTAQIGRYSYDDTLIFIAVG